MRDGPRTTRNGRVAWRCGLAQKRGGVRHASLCPSRVGRMAGFGGNAVCASKPASILLEIFRRGHPFAGRFTEIPSSVFQENRLNPRYELAAGTPPEPVGRDACAARASGKRFLSAPPDSR